MIDIRDHRAEKLLGEIGRLQNMGIREFLEIEYGTEEPYFIELMELIYGRFCELAGRKLPVTIVGKGCRTQKALRKF